ncbi:hypothetical protein ACEWY4_000218 [Coilia grayii]|uniref:LITAF domain-containing protein n=1 Tax=Coilia grayii TaxID=363190 RepID=A0ABD1KW35_9TELE
MSTIVLHNPAPVTQPPVVMMQQPAPPPVVMMQQPAPPPVLMMQQPAPPPVVMMQQPAPPPVVMMQQPAPPPVVMMQQPAPPPVVMMQQPAPPPVVMMQQPAPPPVVMMQQPAPPPVMMTQQPAVTQQQPQPQGAQGISKPVTCVIASAKLGGKPTITACNNCRQRMETRVIYKSGCFAWAMAILLCFLGLFFGPCLIPFFWSKCKDAHHYCTLCNTKLCVHKPCC